MQSTVIFIVDPIFLDTREYWTKEGVTAMIFRHCGPNAEGIVTFDTIRILLETQTATNLCGEAIRSPRRIYAVILPVAF